jgi:hypothetical protein
MKNKTYIVNTKIFNLLYSECLCGSVFHQTLENGTTRMKIAEGSNKYVKDLFAKVKIPLTAEA